MSRFSPARPTLMSRRALALLALPGAAALALACSPPAAPISGPALAASTAPPATAASATGRRVSRNPAPASGAASSPDTSAAPLLPATGRPQARPLASAAASVDPRFPPPLPASAPGAPDLNRLLTRLRPFAARRFDALAQGRGCPADQTLGQYLELLVREGSPKRNPPGDLRRLSGTCIEFPPPDQMLPVDLPADAGHWFCSIDSFVSDPPGESPWHYELRLRVRRDGVVDLANLSCPGLP